MTTIGWILMCLGGVVALADLDNPKPIHNWALGLFVLGSLLVSVGHA